MNVVPPAGPGPAPVSPAGQPNPAAPPPFNGPRPPYGPPPGGPTPPLPERSGFPWRRLMMLLAVYLPPTVGALTLAWVIKFSVSPSGIAIGVAAAVLPVPLLVGCVLWLGRYNHRPVRYLIFCFAWGALVATGVSVLVNTSVSVALEQVDWAFLDHIDRPSEDVMPWPDFFAAIASAPVIEELTKALAPFAIFLFRRRHFTGVLDGIVYCGLAGIGFAMVENILYLGRGFDQGDEFFGIGGGVLITGMTFVMRILFSGFAHPLFSSMIGIGLGMSRRRRPGPGRLLIPLGMVVAAMLLHSAWNLIASLGPAILLSGYMAVMVPIFFTVVGVALWLRAADARLAVTALSDLVDAGLLSPPEIAALATHRRRGAARLWARRVAGDAGFKAMREYQRLATQLSATRDAVARGFTPPDPETERQLLQRLLTYREVFTGADPAMPRATWDGRYYQVQFPDGSIRQINPPVQPIMPIPIMPPGVPRPVPPVPAWRPAS